MSVTRENDEIVNVRRGESLLIDVIEHYEIGEVLFIMRARVLRFDYEVADLAYARDLRAHPGIGKVREEQHFLYIELFRYRVAPLSDAGPQGISFVHRNVPVLEIDEYVGFRFGVFFLKS